MSLLVNPAFYGDVPQYGYNYGYGIQPVYVRPMRRLDSYVRSRARSQQRKALKRSKGSRSNKHALLTVASYLYKKTGRSWFVGPHGVYLSVPAGVTAEPAARELIADIPEARDAAIYTPSQRQLYIPSPAAQRLAARLTMRDETIRDYCRKIGAPHEQRFFKHPIACDPWLASQAAMGRFGGTPYHLMSSSHL
jgi:hypothetical protein